jgi:hypothetical protein
MKRFNPKFREGNFQTKRDAEKEKEKPTSGNPT